MNIQAAPLNLFFILIAAASAAALAIRPLNRYPLLRAAAYSLILFLLLTPVIETGIRKTRKPLINIYVDYSRSMSVENRFNAALGAARELYSELRGSADISFFKLSSEAEKVSLEQLSHLSPDGKSTNLSSILEGDSPNGRIVITDGRHNLGPNPLGLRELAAAPVFAIGTGSDYEVPDLAIMRPRVPPIAYRGREIKVEFKISNAAPSSGNTGVYLKREGSLIASKSVDLARRSEIPVEFTFTPTEAGLKEYTLEVDSIDGEINTANNRRTFHLNVKRDRIRILYVSGQPSWEYSFLRRLLLSDPHVELVSFLILRNPDNVTIVPETELSLIHFPAREMFTEEIYNFDLLFYDNFSYRRFFPSAYLDHIKNFVEQGGGFIMLGGEDSFGRGGYAETSIEEILPVKIDPGSNWVRERVSPVVAGELSHPILELAADITTSKKIWSEMPDMEGYDPKIKASGNAEVLVESPEGLPLIVSGSHGKGRVLVFNSNSTWRWAMGLSGQGKTPYYYNRFWQNTLRYAMQSPETEQVRIFPEKDAAAIGETITINIKVLDSSFEPAEDSAVRLALTLPDGSSSPLPGARPSDQQGWYESRLPVELPGTHIINAQAYNSNGMLLGRGRAEFRGVEIDMEMARVSINRNLLKEMAARSGGSYFRPGEIDPEAILSALAGFAETEPERTFPWHLTPVFIFILLLIVLEWYFSERASE